MDLIQRNFVASLAFLRWTFLQLKEVERLHQKRSGVFGLRWEESPIASVQRTRTTLASHSTIPNETNAKQMNANRAIRIAAQRPRGPKDQKNSRFRARLNISSENEIFERATHRGPIFCWENETSRLKFSSLKIEFFDRYWKNRARLNFFVRWALWGTQGFLWGAKISWGDMTAKKRQWFESRDNSCYSDSAIATLSAGNSLINLVRRRHLN